MSTLNLEKTHASKVAADQLVNELANKVVTEGITPLKALTSKAQEDAKADDWQIYLSGSSFTAANVNPLHFLVNKFVKVFYGLNAKLVLGSAYHKGLEIAGATFIETGKYPRFGLALRAAVEYIDKNISLIKSEERPEPKELYCEVSKLLKAYWPELNKNTPLAVEVFVQMPTPEFMLRSKENAAKIILTGAADIIYHTKDGKVLSDHKTSSKPISGDCKKPEKMISLEKSIKADKAALIKAKKLADKHADAPDKLAEARKQLGDTTLQIVEASDAGKPVTALKKRQEKWQKEILKQTERNTELKVARNQAKALRASIKEDEEVLESMMSAYEEDKAKADLLEAKRSHGQQLAFYAMLYMITTGEQIQKVRLENMVKVQKPYLQVFEWELDDMSLAKAEEQIRAAVTRIELMLEGIDPLVLFPLNTYSFIGSETNKLVAEIEEAAEELKREVNFEDVCSSSHSAAA